MPPTVLPFHCLKAPENWRTVEFISDLHLQDKEPETCQLWQQYMLETTADAVFILGDLFEVWVGDDAVAHANFLQHCQSILKTTAAQRYVGFMRGNRDFLVGPEFLKDCQVHDLHDPTVLQWGQQTWLLCHGDEGCLDDHSYQSFRSMVRSPDWQFNFLQKPLQERLEIARQMRTQSEENKANPNAIFADVDEAWATERLRLSQSQCMVHGHTHQPADHIFGSQGQWVRRVLSDWDAGHHPRAEVLRWHASGQVERINLIRA